jgi:hypothetical protein
MVFFFVFVFLVVVLEFELSLIACWTGALEPCPQPIWALTAKES